MKINEQNIYLKNLEKELKKTRMMLLIKIKNWTKLIRK